MELLRQGVIGEDVGDPLLEAMDLKLEQVERGETGSFGGSGGRIRGVLVDGSC